MLKRCSTKPVFRFFSISPSDVVMHGRSEAVDQAR